MTGIDMLGNAMVEACPAEGDAPVPITPAGGPALANAAIPIGSMWGCFGPPECVSWPR